MREAAALELARKIVKSLTREENELLIRLTASLILVDIEKDATAELLERKLVHLPSGSNQRSTEG